jgi:protein involved in polysaccharide export with SLBB domain
MKQLVLHISLVWAIGLVPLAAQIQAGRAIQITVSGVPAEEKSRFDPIYPVSESGMINLPFIGTVRAAGLRGEQLAAVLQERYKAAGIYRDPVFQVIDSNAKTIDQQVVYFGGDVRQPGPVPYNRTLTLFQALQAAGGENEFGSIKRITLFRNGRSRLIDLSKPESMNILLEPNDTIEVPRKNWLGQ